MNNRITGWFSCGAASAVAIKLALVKYPQLDIKYCRVKEEHPDNLRFLRECEDWYGQKIDILINEKYDGSIIKLFLKDKYLIGPRGGRCTLKLKKELRKKYQLPSDVQIFGYCKGEEERENNMIDSEPSLLLDSILIDEGVTHQDCLGILEKVGIKLPVMYAQGYEHNNCIGCVKGGMGYWNKIRVDYPDQFNMMALVEEILGRTVLREFKNGQSLPLPLKNLHPDRGNFKDEVLPECGVTCEYVSETIKDG